jgi:hypothetical protein
VFGSDLQVVESRGKVSREEKENLDTGEMDPCLTAKENNQKDNELLTGRNKNKRNQLHPGFEPGT